MAGRESDGFDDALVEIGRPRPWAPDSFAGRLRRRLLSEASGIHAPLFWRALYFALHSPLVVGASARALQRLDPERADGVLARTTTLLVLSGWPHHSRGWMNLDASRLLWRIRHRLLGTTRTRARAPRRLDGDAVRLGLIGQLGNLLTFSADHVRAVPADVELHVFDVAYRGRHARYLDVPGVAYHPLPADADVAVLAAAVEREQLDVLLPYLSPADSLALLDRVDVPCIANAPTGSDVLHHPRVGFRLFVQPQADYFVRDDRLFCGTSRAAFDDVLTVEGRLAYDARDLAAALEGAVPSWAEREPLIVVHGALYKLASRPYLELLAGLLEADTDLQLLVTGRGKDADVPFRAVTELMRRRGLGDRFHHVGAYSRRRNDEDGGLADPGWLELVRLLGRARLAPDPWPFGGASARVEAYILGTPAVHMATRFDEASWGRPQWSVVDVPALLVERGTASDPQEYLELCRRCLYDEAFADALVEDQRAVAREVVDAAPFWRQLRETYVRWATP
jgi:hypothetical protein